MKINRRRFMTAAGASAASLPFLLRGRRGSANADFPRRLVIFMTPNSAGGGGRNGRPEDYWPQDASVTGSHVLAPLTPHAEKLLVLRGVDMQSALMGQIPPDHQPDWTNALTGKQALIESSNNWVGSSISVDQHIANAIGDATPHRSLHFGVQSGGKPVLYRGPNESVPEEKNPYSAADRLFGDLDRDAGELERLQLERASVLNALREDGEAIRCRFGAGGAQTIASHLRSIDGYESSLGAIAPLGASCALPQLGSRVDDINAEANYDTIARAQMDLITMALTCDLTRVTTLRLGKGGQMVPAHGGQWEWHRTIHDNAAETELRHEVERNAGRMMAEHFSYLLDRMDSVPEGDGTLLDHSIVLWLTEQGLGCCHRRTDMGYVLAGGAGYFRTGEKMYFKTDNRTDRGQPLGVPHNRLLMSICDAMGASVDTFGEPSLCTDGPLIDIHR